MTNNVKIQTADLSVIDKIVVIVPEFTQWTGTRAMHEGDFRIGTNGQLPPKEVAKSLGLKAIINIEKLRIFDRINLNFPKNLHSNTGTGDYFPKKVISS